jgi:hypothetical protein
MFFRRTVPILPLAAFQISDELIEARVVLQGLQIVVSANELSIFVTSFNGVVKVVEGFVAAACSSGQAGEVIPKPGHIAAVRPALIDAYRGDRVEIELLHVLVASGFNQRSAEDPKRLHRVVVQRAKSSQLIVEG